jgi:hypothetical protein
MNFLAYTDSNNKVQVVACNDDTHQQELLTQYPSGVILTQTQWQSLVADARFLSITNGVVSVDQTAKANDKLVNYKMYRSAEYPPITDYLDGIVKGDQTQVQTYINACLAVKQKYPKT